jgi:hypothetical protein
MPRVSKAQKDKLIEIRERYKKAVDADRENRQDAMDDMKFVYEPGEQWEDNVRTERGNRPMYEFNKVRVSVKRVVNDMRANRPQGKVRGVEEGDKKTAEIYEGLIRNIWNTSDGDTVIDQAAEYQVAGGMGAWRVTVDYASPDAWEQDIRIEPIRNPFLLYADPASQDYLKRDARYWFLTSKMPRNEFEARWPKAAKADFDDEVQFDDEDTWDDGERVRVVEYWYKEPVKQTIVLLSDGRTVNADELEQHAEQLMQAGVQVIKSREVMAHKIRMCIASGDAILEEAEWAGTEFPFVLVYGENLLIDGENRWFGLTRYAKDPQRAYNYTRTYAIETIARAPQAKFWATPTQAKGLTDQWAEAHKKNWPFLLSNPDPQQPGFPQPMNYADVPPAVVNEMQFSSEDIKAVTGIFDASLGARSNEQTGVAIRARQAQGEIAVYNFMDNLSKGIRRTWEILIDLIPKVYDTPRIMRVLGTDGAENYVELNKPDPVTGAVLNDITHGKYDVTVTVGPSFSTQRQEAAEVYMAMAQANPAIMQIAGDLIFKSLDLPYADKIADRLKAMLPPQLQQLEAQGSEVPPEAMQALAQAEQAMQMVQQQAAMVQQAAAEADEKSAEVQKAISDLEVKRAQFEAQVAKRMADITTAEAQLTLQAAQAGSDEQGKAVAADRESLSAQVQQALAAIQQQAAEFMTQAAGVIAEMQSRTQPQVVVTGGRKRFMAQRDEAGRLVGGVIEEVA